MWIRLRVQIVKELLSLLRDPKSRFVVIGPPLAQLFIFAFAATLEVENVDLAVLDEDAGRWSWELTESIGKTNLVDQLHILGSTSELRNIIENREAIAALHLPADFSRNILAGRPATAQVILDGRRANAAQITLGYLNRITADLMDEGPDQHRPVTVETRHWFNANLHYMWFTVPSLVGILSMFSALLVTSLSIARERELGTFEQLLVSPALSMEIIVGKTIPALMIGVALGTVMILAGIFVFNIPFTGSLALLYAGLLVFILSVVGVGLMISSASQTQQQAILGAFALGVPLVLLSGFATPVANMPRTLQWLAEANPLKHFLIVVQGSFLKAMPASDIWPSVWPMLVIALVTFTSAVIFVNRRLQ